LVLILQLSANKHFSSLLNLSLLSSAMTLCSEELG